jgi:hypothetical protein
MRCEQCRGSMNKGHRYDLPDGANRIAVTAWRCPACDELAEEILLIPSQGQGQRRHFRYRVRAFQSVAC